MCPRLAVVAAGLLGLPLPRPSAAQTDAGLPIKHFDLVHLSLLLEG